MVEQALVEGSINELSERRRTVLKEHAIKNGSHLSSKQNSNAYTADGQNLSHHISHGS